MSQILFDEAAHTYTVNGVVRQSVTQIIGGAGLIDDRWFTEDSRNRGKAVHAATHYLDENDLDIGTVHEAHRPYVDAWNRFKIEARFTPQLIEHRIFHPTFGYCGTLDRTGILGDGSLALIDIKTGIAEPWHGCQLSAYGHALDLAAPDKYRKMTVLLRKDGTYKVHEYSTSQYRDHWNVFLACLTLVNFRMEEKYVRNGNSTNRAA